MFVVTTVSSDGRRAGCLVGFASQLSIHPPRFLAGLSKQNYTFEVATTAQHLAVHVIGRERHDVARLFGSQTGDEVDKFARCNWHSGPHGLPILADSAAWFAGAILERFDMGDHVGFLIAPATGRAPATLPPLVTFGDVRDLDPGHDA